MTTSNRSKAEVALAAIRTNEKAAPSEQDATQRERAELGAKLRDLRLAKEKADAEAAENAAAERPKGRRKKPPRLPQTHRR